MSNIFNNVLSFGSYKFTIDIAVFILKNDSILCRAHFAAIMCSHIWCCGQFVDNKPVQCSNCFAKIAISLPMPTPIVTNLLSDA